jgi:hypothetical protein
MGRLSRIGASFSSFAVGITSHPYNAFVTSLIYSAYMP